MRKLSSTLLLLMMLFVSSFAWAAETEHVTETRSWDFTKGSAHADQVTNCDYWSAGSKGRYSLAIALDDQ